jgi:hypothetical protein
VCVCWGESNNQVGRIGQRRGWVKNETSFRTFLYVVGLLIINVEKIKISASTRGRRKEKERRECEDVTSECLVHHDAPYSLMP